MSLLAATKQKTTKNKRKIVIKQLFLAALVIITSVAAANAVETGASLGLEAVQIDGDITTTTTLSFDIALEGGVTVPFAGVEILAYDEDLVLDKWQVGVALPNVVISLGEQGSLFVENDFEFVGGDTLAMPADDFVSVMVGFEHVSFMLAFSDIGTDGFEVENMQVNYLLTLPNVDITTAVDYNFNTNYFTIGAEVDTSITDNVAVGGIVTWAESTEDFAYELDASYGIASAFVNGDENNWLQNVGIGINYQLDSVVLVAEAAYNLDTDVETVGIGVNFNF